MIRCLNLVELQLQFIVQVKPARWASYPLRIDYFASKALIIFS